VLTLIFCCPLHFPIKTALMKKILLIDDDADDRSFFCEALEEIAPEFGCYAVVNGELALQLLRNNEIGRPDLIFLDVNMPIFDGWQCLSELKSDPDLQQIPVIMYSTSSHPEDIEKALSERALYFFTKPYNFSGLKKSMELVTVHLVNGTLHRLADSSPLFTGSPDSDHR